MTTIPATPVPPPAADVRASFSAQIPRILRHARYALRHVACRDTRADLIAEALALAWNHFAALARRGRGPEEFVATLALRCTQAVRAGRRLAGCDRTRDVLSPVARARHGFAVARLGDVVPAPVTVPGEAGAEVLVDALAVAPRARVAEQAAFRIDFPAWRARFGRRDRAVLDALATGAAPGGVAAQFGISPSRVSQLREGFRASWHAFHRGEW